MRVCERKISPLRLTRSTIASLSSSDASRRKQTSEKWRGAQTSHPGSSRTHLSKTSDKRRTAQSLSERNRLPRAGPYSDRLSTSSLVRRYSGTRLNAWRMSSGRLDQRSEQSIGVKSHLCALTTSESARSTPACDQRSSGQTQAEPA